MICVTMTDLYQVLPRVCAESPCSLRMLTGRYLLSLLLQADDDAFIVGHAGWRAALFSFYRYAPSVNDFLPYTNAAAGGGGAGGGAGAASASSTTSSLSRRKRGRSATAVSSTLKASSLWSENDRVFTMACCKTLVHEVCSARAASQAKPRQATPSLTHSGPPSVGNSVCTCSRSSTAFTLAASCRAARGSRRTRGRRCTCAPWTFASGHALSLATATRMTLNELS